MTSSVQVIFTTKFHYEDVLIFLPVAQQEVDDLVYANAQTTVLQDFVKKVCNAPFSQPASQPKAIPTSNNVLILFLLFVMYVHYVDQKKTDFR